MTTIPLFLVLLAVASAHALEGQVVLMDSNNNTEIQEGNGYTLEEDVAEGTPLLRGPHQKKQQKKGDGGDDGLLKVALQNPEGSLFYAIIDVGTPLTPFRVSIDSGSSNLWLLDESYESFFTEKMRQGHMYYNKKHSSTHKNYKKRGDTPTFSFSYGDGSEYEGEMGVDEVWVGGKQITGVEFGAVSWMNPKAENLQTGVDGLLGIGLQANAFNKATSLLGAMKSQKIIDQDIFSIYITPGCRSGWLIFGGIDNTMHSGGEIKYHHIVDAGSKNAHMWALQFNTLQFGGGSSSEEEKIVLAENFVGEFDSGASEMFAPKDVMETIQKGIEKVRGAEAWFLWKELLLECEYAEQLPPLIFVINGQLLSFSASQYFGKRVKPVNTDEGEICKFFMSVRPDGLGRISMGVPFLEKYYTVFNASGKKQSMGFAEGVEQNFHRHSSPNDDSSHQKKRRSSSHKKSP